MLAALGRPQTRVVTVKLQTPNLQQLPSRPEPAATSRTRETVFNRSTECRLLIDKLPQTWMAKPLHTRVLLHQESTLWLLMVAHELSGCLDTCVSQLVGDFVGDALSPKKLEALLTSVKVNCSGEPTMNAHGHLTGVSVSLPSIQVAWGKC